MLKAVGFVLGEIFQLGAFYPWYTLSSLFYVLPGALFHTWVMQE